MSDALQIYGFTYRYDGKTFAVDVVANSQLEAQTHLSAMANATAVGELRLVPDATCDSGVLEASNGPKSAESRGVFGSLAASV